MVTIFYVGAALEGQACSPPPVPRPCASLPGRQPIGKTRPCSARSEGASGPLLGCPARLLTRSLPRPSLLTAACAFTAPRAPFGPCSRLAGRQLTNFGFIFILDFRRACSCAAFGRWWILRGERAIGAPSRPHQAGRRQRTQATRIGSWRPRQQPGGCSCAPRMAYGAAASVWRQLSPLGAGRVDSRGLSAHRVR